MAKYDYLKWCIKVANADLAGDVDFLVKEGLKMDFGDGGWPVYSDIDAAFLEMGADKWFADNLIYEGVAIKENVIAYATANTNGEDFQLEFELELSDRKLTIDGKLSPLTRQGKVRFERVIKNEDAFKKFERVIKNVDAFKKFLGDKIKAQEKDEFFRQLFVSYSNRDIGNDDEDQEVVKVIESFLRPRVSRVPGLSEEYTLNEFVMKFYETIEIYCQDKNCKLNEVPIRLCKLDTCKRPFFGRLMNQQFCKKRHGEIWHAKQAYRKKTLGR